MWGLSPKEFLHWLHSAAWVGAFLFFSVTGMRNAMRAYFISKPSSKTNKAIAPSVDEADEPRVSGDPLPLSEFGMRAARHPR